MRHAVVRDRLFPLCCHEWGVTSDLSPYPYSQSRILFSPSLALVAQSYVYDWEETQQQTRCVQIKILTLFSMYNCEIRELTNKHDKSCSVWFNSRISLCLCLHTQTSKNQINYISSPIWFHFMLSVFSTSLCFINLIFLFFLLYLF